MAGLTLDPDGTWRHDGQIVRHKRLSALLHRSVSRDENGALIVTTGRDVLPFAAEDAPRIIRALEHGPGGWTLHFLGGDTEPLDPNLPLTIDESGVIRSRVASDRFWARWSRSATQALLSHAGEELAADGALPLVMIGLKLAVTPTKPLNWTA